MIRRKDIGKVSSIEELAKEIEDQLEGLKSTYAFCWLCNKDTNSWTVIVPDAEHKDLGFGMPSGINNTRVLFVPVCDEHDTTDPVFRKELLYQLKVRSSSYRN